MIPGWLARGTNFPAPAPASIFRLSRRGGRRRSCPASGGGGPVHGRLGRRVVGARPDREREAAAEAGLDHDGAAVGELAAEEHLRDRRLEAALHHALERPRALQVTRYTLLVAS